MVLLKDVKMAHIVQKKKKKNSNIVIHSHEFKLLNSIYGNFKVLVGGLARIFYFYH